jgi:hypothetical protein
MARALPHLLTAFVLGFGLMYILLGRAVKPAVPAATPPPTAITQPAEAATPTANAPAAQKPAAKPTVK